MEELIIEDKKYFSSKKAAQVTGYAKDYIGQLCREGRVESRQVGRNWYVLETAIMEHRFGKNEEEKPPIVEEQPTTVQPKIESETEWNSPRYSVEDVKSIPELRSADLSVLLEEELHVPEIYPLKEEPETVPVEQKMDIIEDIEEEIDTQPVQIHTDPEVTLTKHLNEADIYEEDDRVQTEIPITMHQIDQQSVWHREEEEEEEYVEETPVRANLGFNQVRQTVNLVAAFVFVIITVSFTLFTLVNMGVFEKISNRDGLTGATLNFFEGVSE